ncbi:MAG: NADH-quinone oxidoreductase subunit F [bacterium]|nr:NADH-quinone oxidoreductase subunit F [bacterium]
MLKIKTIDDLHQIHHQADKQLYPDKIKITVGVSSCGISAGADLVFRKIQEKVDQLHFDAIVASTGCIGYCQQEPIVAVRKPNQPVVFYGKVDVKKAEEIVTGLKTGKMVTDSILGKLEQNETLLNPHQHQYSVLPGNSEYAHIPSLFELPFYSKQKRVITRNCGFINPDSIEEYIAQGGYYSLYQVLSQKIASDAIVSELKTARLRGRSGEGFPTALKWEAAKKVEAPVKYIICNGSECDPIAVKDRLLFESDPHAVIEGMLIGAYTIGAKEGYIYLRSSYTRAIEKIQNAIQQAERYGLLGDDICGTGFSFKLKVIRGAGSYMTAAATALLAAIEGFVPEPRAKYVHVLEQGLYNKPTVINSPETLANIPVIIGRGGTWFAGIGTERSKGTKLFTLSGAIKNSGIIEIPMGITIKEIITDIGEGASPANTIKGIHFGGPSGGILSLNSGTEKSFAETAVDFEQLAAAGSTIGSGSIFVIPKNLCIVDYLKSHVDFLKEEICGKCTPCREGIRNISRILTAISNGKGNEQDLDLLQEIAAVMIDTSLCEIGVTATNPILSSLVYFNEEYRSHIRDKTCRIKPGSAAKPPNLNAKMVW